MAQTSRFILLSPSVLLEYIYTDPGAPSLLTNNFYRIANSHTGFGAIPKIQLLNVDNQIDITGNVQERSALRIGGAQWMYLDNDQIPTWLQYDSSVSVTNISATSIGFDEVRFHLMAGYNFEDIDGLLFTIEATERSTKKLTLANLAYQKSATWTTYSPRPILINDILYDRYVSVKIPSVFLAQQIFDSFEGSPSQALTFAAIASSDGKGFMRQIPLSISVTEISSTTEQIVGAATYLRFQGGNNWSVSINQYDEAAAFAAVIQPSTSGDYFEYYGTWNSQFPEDFIYQQNALGNSYILIHQLRVQEQVGGSFITTADLSFIQQENYDQANLFRPIIKNASTAISYSLDYTVKLYNKKDGSQIIRTASYTGFNAKTWGAQLDRINLLYKPTPYRVYNKIVSGPTFTQKTFFPSTPTIAIPNASAVIPVFFEKNTILLSEKTLYVGKDGTLTQGNSGGEVKLKGIGTTNINIDPFDNWFKFQVFKEESNGTSPAPLDLGSTVKYSLVFIADDDTKIAYEMQNSSEQGTYSQGMMVFKIPAEDTSKILSITEKKFYIVLTGTNAGTSSLYWGWFNSPDNVIVAETVNTTSTTVQAEPAAQPATINAAGANLVNATTEQSNAGVPALPSGIKIPIGIKPSTLQQLKPTSPGAVSSIATEKSSILSKIKPKSPNKKKKETPKSEESTLNKKLGNKNNG